MENARSLPFPYTQSHTHSVRGDGLMGNTPSKEYQFKNAKVVVHSKLVVMTSTERKAWFEEEWEKGNSVLKQIAEAIDNCYR